MATIIWIDGSGNWNTATAWNADAVPGSSDDAVLSAPGSYTVSITTPITVASIAVSDGSATVSVNDPGQTVTVAGELADGGVLLVDLVRRARRD